MFFQKILLRNVSILCAREVGHFFQTGSYTIMMPKTSLKKYVRRREHTVMSLLFKAYKSLRKYKYIAFYKKQLKIFSLFFNKSNLANVYLKMCVMDKKTYFLQVILCTLECLQTSAINNVCNSQLLRDLYYKKTRSKKQMLLTYDFHML